MAISVDAVGAMQVQQWGLATPASGASKNGWQLLTRTSRPNGPQDPRITAGERPVRYAAADDVSELLHPPELLRFVALRDESQ